jgi:hypothetical protein
VKRTLLLATFAIVSLFGGALAFVLVMTRPVPMPAPTAHSDPAAEVDPPAQATAVAPDPPPATLHGGRLYGPRKASAASPATAPAADRVTRKAVHRALRDPRLRSGLARCADGSGGFGDVPAGGRVPRARPASLVLELELGAGELRIVDARVRDWGGASEASVTCARAVLVDHVVPAPARRRPRSERVEMSYSLNPRSDAIASSR